MWFSIFSRSRSRADFGPTCTGNSDSELPLHSHSYSGSLSLSTTRRSNCSSLDCVSIKVWKMFVRVSVQPSYLASQKWNLGLWVSGTLPPKVKELHPWNSTWTKIRSYTNVRSEITHFWRIYLEKSVVNVDAPKGGASAYGDRRPMRHKVAHLCQVS